MIEGRTVDLFRRDLTFASLGFEIYPRRSLLVPIFALKINRVFMRRRQIQQT